MINQQTNLSGLQSFVDELLELFLGGVLADILLQLQQPNEHLLVGQTVKWSSKTVKTGGERQVGIAESGTDQVSCVCRNIATFVITVNGQIETHQLGELLVVEAQHACVVGRPIQFGVDGSTHFSALVRVTVDGGGNDRQLRNQIHAVFVHRLPVLGLLDSLF